MLNALKKLFSKKSETPAVEVPVAETPAPYKVEPTPSFNYEDVKPQAVVLTPVVEAKPAKAKKASAAKKAPAAKKPRAPKKPKAE